MVSKLCVTVTAPQAAMPPAMNELLQLLGLPCAQGYKRTSPRGGRHCADSRLRQEKGMRGEARGLMTALSPCRRAIVKSTD